MLRSQICLFICPQPFQKTDVASRRDLWSKTPVRREQLYEPSCYVGAKCWGEGTGKRNHNLEGLRLSSLAVQLGYSGAMHEGHQQWTKLYRSEGRFIKNPEVPVLKEESHCWVGGGEGPGDFSWHPPCIWSGGGTAWLPETQRSN